MTIDWTVFSLAVLSFLTLVSSWMVLFTRSLMKACLSLILVMVLVSGIFMFSGADFLAASQIVVYVGGILVLMVVGIVMTKTLHVDNQKINIFKILAVPLISFAIALLFWGELQKLNLDIPNENVHALEPTIEMGRSFLTDKILIFELVALFLTLALVASFSIVSGTAKK